MTDRKLVTVDDAQDTLHSAETSATDTGQWSNNYVSQLAHTVITQSEQIKRMQAAVNELLSEYNRLDMEEQRMEEPHEEPRETTYHDLGLTPEDME